MWSVIIATQCFLITTHRPEPQRGCVNRLKEAEMWSSVVCDKILLPCQTHHIDVHIQHSLAQGSDLLLIGISHK